jgi:hypothetical protein
METMTKADDHNKAYWYGWNDGLYREPCCFTENPGWSS